MTICYICEKAQLVKSMEPYRLYGEDIGSFEAEKCPGCGEVFYSEETSRKMTESAKNKGLWGLNSETKVGESGTTLDIRLPKKIIQFMKIKKGTKVRVYPEGRRRLVMEI